MHVNIVGIAITSQWRVALFIVNDYITFLLLVGTGILGYYNKFPRLENNPTYLFANSLANPIKM